MGDFENGRHQKYLNIMKYTIEHIVPFHLGLLRKMILVADNTFPYPQNHFVQELLLHEKQCTHHEGGGEPCWRKGVEELMVEICANILYIGAVRIIANY